MHGAVGRKRSAVLLSRLASNQRRCPDTTIGARGGRVSSAAILPCACTALLIPDQHCVHVRDYAALSPNADMRSFRATPACPHPSCRSIPCPTQPSKLAQIKHSSPQRRSTCAWYHGEGPPGKFLKPVALSVTVIAKITRFYKCADDRIHRPRRHIQVGKFNRITGYSTAW